MARGNDYIYYTNEGNFKSKLPKLYQLVFITAATHMIDLTKFQFVRCEGIGDIIDIDFTDNIQDFYLSAKGSEKHGYRLLDNYVCQTIEEDDNSCELDEDFEKYPT
jgi:hypothetical protein